MAVVRRAHRTSTRSNSLEDRRAVGRANNHINEEMRGVGRAIKGAVVSTFCIVMFVADPTAELKIVATITSLGYKVVRSVGGRLLIRKVVTKDGKQVLEEITEAEQKALAKELGDDAAIPRACDFAEGELDKHFSTHAGEWTSITKDAYLKRARKLLDSSIGGEILGKTRANGDILRYNTRTNELAIMTSDGRIRTLFRPRGGIDYWNRQ